MNFAHNYTSHCIATVYIACGFCLAVATLIADTSICPLVLVGRPAATTVAVSNGHLNATKATEQQTQLVSKANSEN